MSPCATARKTGGASSSSMTAVIATLSEAMKRRSARNDALPWTSAAAALMIMMIGASTSIASENATPNAARLNLASGNRAISAVRNGPSSDIISHVAASGSQNTAMRRVVSCVPVAS